MSYKCPWCEKDYYINEDTDEPQALDGSVAHVEKVNCPTVYAGPYGNVQFLTLYVYFCSCGGTCGIVTDEPRGDNVYVPANFEGPECEQPPWRPLDEEEESDWWQEVDDSESCGSED